MIQGIIEIIIITAKIDIIIIMETLIVIIGVTLKIMETTEENLIGRTIIIGVIIEKEV